MKMSQEAVSLFMGINHKLLANWELRGAFPQFKYFPKIIEFLGYNPVKIDNPNSISGKVTLCCIYAGLTRIQLSHRLSIEIQELNDWEAGIKEPAQDVCANLESLMMEISKSNQIITVLNV